jgi:DNA-directed RNA polymerase alpha subunit
MIARAKRVYRGIGKKTRGRQRDEDRKIVVDQASEDLGRTVAIHLMGHNYGVARLVVDRAEREWQQSQRTPHDLNQVPLEDLGLSDRFYQALVTEPGIRSAGDLMNLRDGQLLQIGLIGPLAVKEIREKCSHWLGRIAAAT